MTAAARDTEKSASGQPRTPPETSAQTARATEAPVAVRPRLPAARGPISQAVIDLCAGRDEGSFPCPRVIDPYGEDLHLALYVCYELHYRGFDGVPDAMEWDVHLLGLRLELEAIFLEALRRDVPGGDDLDAELAALLRESVGQPSVSQHLATLGTIEQFREYVSHRSAYHLKEADPQLLVVSRLDGPAKAGLVAVEHDEYGAGRHSAMHSELYAEMMRELGLPSAYGAELDRISGTVLAEVNLMTLCGLRRELRGASVGQFAVIELTSSPGSARLVKAARRLGCGPHTEYYYAEHVEADAVHEQILRREVLAPLVEREPELRADLVFGIQASQLLGGRFADEVLAAWSAGRSSLR
ncbi:iron-containing redox enzyme family protein [Knoellia sp. Soil729]|uniref:iron-containing redox enzyme family protein n=1 Tax=Knoellia sp. Soil729 TaxID=1736394 RepID=UPI000AD7543E|nr:iron-containing redox enzyme family protein [Knoellia sp. Soil729]